MADAFWQARLTKTEELIVIYEDAIDALGVKGFESYTLDTGQTRQTVKYIDLTMLNKTLTSLYNRRGMILARCNGGGVIHQVPDF